jgi:hypothetical protein
VCNLYDKPLARIGVRDGRIKKELGPQLGRWLQLRHFAGTRWEHWQSIRPRASLSVWAVRSAQSLV